MSATKKETEFVGMLHVPVNSIVAAPVSWRDALGLPSAISEDWKIIAELETLWLETKKHALLSPFFTVNAEITVTLHDQVRRLSFYSYLLDRLLREAGLYSKYEADSMLLENIAAPYFVRSHQPAVIFAVMSAMAHELRREYPDGRFGIQLLAFSDDLAMNIAVQNRFSFIRAESVLFEGIRPEGRTPNSGNLAKLYMQRNMLTASEKDYAGPLVFVDIHKKHTAFVPSLNKLETWLDNVLFQKIECIILTGSGTGGPVNEDDFRKATVFLQGLADQNPKPVPASVIPLLFIGSGVSEKNMALCKLYSDGVIVGSSLKENGYWEYPLHEESLKRFMGKWHE